MNDKRPPLLWCAVWLAQLLIMAAFIAIYWGLPVDGATGDLNSFLPEGYLVQWVIEERPGGLQVGDVIQTAGGYSVEEWLAGPAERSPAWETGQTITYQVLRQGQNVELQVELRPLSFAALWAHWGVQFIGLIALVLIGSFVFFQRPHYTAAHWFMVFCLTNALQMVGDGWNFQFAILPRLELFRFHYINEHVSYGLIWVSAIMEGLTFPRRYPILERHSRKIVAVLSFVFFGLTFAPVFFAPSLIDGLRISNEIVVALASIYLIIALGIMLYTLRHTRDLLIREQIKFWVLAAGVAAVVAIPFHYLPIIFTGKPLLPHPLTSALTLILLPLGLATAILGFRMYEIEFILNRSLVYGTLTAILAALFGGSLLLINNLARSLTGSEQSIIAITIAAAIFGGLFQPSRRAIQRFVDHRLFGIGIDYQKMIKEIQRDTTSAFYPAQQIKVGDYTNITLMNTGGMSIIYKADDPAHNRSVALKLLTTQLLNDEHSRYRFQREVEIIAALNHPNVLQLYDHGEINQIPYMALEFINGPTLSQYISQHAPLPLEAVLPLVADIAAALDYLHDTGLVHRDLKPSNIMLETSTGQDGDINRAVIMDFGIAKAITGDFTLLTFTGLLGSFEYIAPEQIESAAKVDRRADIYALGGIIYHMIAGVLPFASRNPGALLIAHLQTKPLDPRHYVPTLPEPAAAAILQALEKKPDDRFPTAGGFLKALEGSLVAISA